MALDLNQLRDRVLNEPSPSRENNPPAPPTPPSSTNRNTGGGWFVWLVVIVFVIWLVSTPNNKKAPSQAEPSSTQQSPAERTSVPVSRPQPTIDTGELVRRVKTANSQSILRAIAIAETGTTTEIEDAASVAGRDFNFSDLKISRRRDQGRSLNDRSIAAFRSQRIDEAYRIQEQAFAADPLDIEIAGNFALYSLLNSKLEQAFDFSVYALSLPRSVGKTGRTADWSTLAAAFATSGDYVKARGGLYITLAITRDIPRRCSAAISSTKTTYGQVLQNATNAMFERIRDRGLSTSGDCKLPIQW